MKVLVHAGIDKAGSSAIQAHLHANREWLRERGVHLPQTGLTRFGHRGLFLPELEQPAWTALAEELRSARQDGASWSVVSFEGICRLRRPQIEYMQKVLGDHDSSLLFYLRDQAEVLQSGYLQNLKAGPQMLTVDELRQDPSQLLLKSRDYSRMLAPFRAVVGERNIQLHPFVDRLLAGGDVVDDVLDKLGLQADEDFRRLSFKQNPSLDIASARLLNRLDQSDSQEDRDALVNDLLLIIRRDGSGERWFLDERGVESIRAHYRASNMQLLKSFGLAIDVEDFFDLSSGPWSSRLDDGSGRLESALHRLNNWPRWNGSKYVGRQLGQMLEGGGWLEDTVSEHWSCGANATIRFRVPLSRHAQRPRDLLLRIEGSYCGGCSRSEVTINGMARGGYSLEKSEIPLSAKDLGRERAVELVLTHAPQGTGSKCYALHSMELERI